MQPSPSASPSSHSPTQRRCARRLLAYAMPCWKLMAGTLAVILLGAVFSLLSPWPLKIILDYVIARKSVPAWLADILGSLSGNPRALLIAMVMILVVLTLLDSLSGVVSNWITTRLDQRMTLDFRADLFAHSQRLSVAFHDQKRSGPLTYAINFQASAASAIILAAPPIIESLVMLAGMVAISFWINWKLAALALAVAPFLWMSIGYYARHIDARIRQVNELEEVSLSIVYEAINMLRVIVAFGREPHENRRFRSQGAFAADARVDLTVRQAVFSLAVKFITGVGGAAVLGVGANEVIAGRMTIGDLVLILGYIAMIYRPLEAISYTLGSLQNNFSNLKMAFELLDLEPEIQDSAGAIELTRARGSIEFRDVSFSYTGRLDTLRGISFSAQAGEVIALVGPTGAGKTTLVSLIPRFYAPSRGQILLDGRNIEDISLHSLREQISMVLQEPLLFSGTIAENIRYGNLDASMEQIIQAARDANAHDFIMRLPAQYETRIGERGAQLSGGERQRLCVARAFLKDAPILILDEPTSSIDSRTESVILDALDLLMRGRTTFMIAHRLSTIRRADKILVLERGRLIEQGRHEELIDRGGLYRQLHDVQLQRARKRRILEPAGAGAAQDVP